MITQYLHAFEQKDLETIKALFAEDISLQDPFVGKVEGFDAVIKVYENMFAANNFKLHILRQYESGGSSAVEFALEITNAQNEVTHIGGVDLFGIVGNKISSIRAYLDTSATAVEEDA